MRDFQWRSRQTRTEIKAALRRNRANVNIRFAGLNWRPVGRNRRSESVRNDAFAGNSFVMLTLTGQIHGAAPRTECQTDAHRNSDAPQAASREERRVGDAYRGAMNTIAGCIGSALICGSIFCCPFLRSFGIRVRVHRPCNGLRSI